MSQTDGREILTSPILLYAPVNVYQVSRRSMEKISFLSNKLLLSMIENRKVPI